MIVCLWKAINDFCIHWCCDQGHNHMPLFWNKTKHKMIAMGYVLSTFVKLDGNVRTLGICIALNFVFRISCLILITHAWLSMISIFNFVLWLHLVKNKMNTCENRQKHINDWKFPSWYSVNICKLVSAQRLKKSLGDCWWECIASHLFHGCWYLLRFYFERIGFFIERCIRAFKLQQ